MKPVTEEPMSTNEASWIKRFREKFKCIQPDCDGNGNIPYQNSEGDWEAHKCQFHYQYLFEIESFISSIREEAVREYKEELKIKILDKFGEWGDPIVSEQLLPFLEKGE